MHSFAGCADEIFKLGSRHPNGGFRAIPVGLLTASGARARARPAHCPSPLTTCASMGAGNSRNWSPGRSSQALARCGGWRRSSVTPLRDRPVGLAAQIGRAGRGGLAAACRVKEDHHPPTAGAPPATPASVRLFLQRRSAGLLLASSVHFKRVVSSAQRGRPHGHHVMCVGCSRSR